jgi:hypothetical protein
VLLGNRDHTLGIADFVRNIGNSTVPGDSSDCAGVGDGTAGGVGMGRITVGTSPRGNQRATRTSTSVLLLNTASFRSREAFSRVKCGARSVIALR